MDAGLVSLFRHLDWFQWLGLLVFASMILAPTSFYLYMAVWGMREAQGREGTAGDTAAPAGAAVAERAGDGGPPPGAGAPVAAAAPGPQSPPGPGGRRPSRKHRRRARR